MKRKVSKIGPSTLMVSLPSSWVKRYGIKKGDEVNIEENGSSLSINTKSVKKDTVGKIELKKGDEFFKRYLFVLYKYGYDKIDISSPEKLNATQLQLALNDMQEFEIFNQQEKTCTIKSIATGIDTEFDNILRRIFQINKTMAEESLLHSKKHDFDSLMSVQALEANNNKLINFCERYLNKRGYKENQKTSFIYVFLDFLEIAADKYRDISRYIATNKLKLSKETLESYRCINEMYYDIYSMFYKFDFGEMAKIKNRREACKENLFNLLTSKKGKEVLVLSDLHSLWNIYHHMELLLFYV